MYQPHITKILQQNSEWGQQVCTGTVSEQHFSELLSSSLVERLLLTPEVPRIESLDWRTLGGGRKFYRVCTLSQKGPLGAAKSFKC